jgi:26S proteasome regulatory subunit N5
MIDSTQDLKLKYYDLMIQQALHQSAYLEVAKHYEKVWDTPSIKEDESKRRAVRASHSHVTVVPTNHQALEHIVYYVVLAPHNNEQSDMLHHLFANPALEKLELH